MKKFLSVLITVFLMSCVIFALSLTVSAKTVNETEDNNSTSTADVISLGDTAKGVISTNSDVDYYKFTVSKNGYLEINFSNTLVDNSSAKWKVTVYKYANSLDEMHCHIVQATYTSTDLPRIGVTPGTYYIEIVDRAYDYIVNVEYGVKVNFTASEYWESELNDSYTTADEINIGNTHSGYIRDDYDKDYYKFTVSKNGYLEINFSNTLVDNSSAKWKVTVYKYANSLDEMHCHIVQATYTSTDLPRIGVTPGTYYIEIVDRAYDYIVNVEYGVKVNFTASEYWESELNDSYTTADEIDIGNTYSGYIRDDYDIDYYKFTVSKNGYLEINFSNTLVNNSSAKWKVTVYKYTNSLDEMHCHVVQATYNSTVLPRIGATPGTYYIEIVDRAYDYIVNVEYGVKVNFTASEYWESELNDSYTTADEIDIGNTYSGYIRDDYDADFYCFEHMDSGSIDITFKNELVNNSSAKWKVVLYKYTNQLKEIASFTAKATDGKTIKSGIGIEKGIYYIKVVDNEYDYIINAEYSICVSKAVKKFIDVRESHWFYDAVNYAVSNGYMNGMSDTTFVPNGNIKREQFVLILANIAGVDTNTYKYTSSGMKDVPTGMWYSGAVTWAVNKGYVSGMTPTTFGTGKDITRTQLARLFYVYAQKNGINVEGRASLSRFADSAKVQDWMRDGLEWAVDVGIISGMELNGKLSLNPNGTATRAQAAVMLMKFDEVK